METRGKKWYSNPNFDPDLLPEDQDQDDPFEEYDDPD